MSPKALQELMDAHGVNRVELAKLLGLHRNTIWRWLKATTPIDAASAALIRERLKTHKKK